MLVEPNSHIIQPFVIEKKKEISKKCNNIMASPIIIPVVIVAIVGLAGYLVYKFAIHDLMCKRRVSQTLQKYNIKKTPSEIIREFHQKKGEEISHKEADILEKTYRQNGPDEFLTMYDAIRDSEHEES